MDPDDHPPGSRFGRAFSALGLIVAGIALAAAVMYLLASAVGLPYIRFHNAHSNGKIAEGDAAFTGVMILAPVLALAGSVGAIVFRRKRAVKWVAAGVAVCGVALAASLAAFLIALGSIDW